MEMGNFAGPMTTQSRNFAGQLISYDSVDHKGHFAWGQSWAILPTGSWA